MAYSETSTIGHLSTTATWFGPGGQAISFFFQPLHNSPLSTTATATETRPKCQNNLSTTVS